MDDYDIRSAASILASVKEQEARFERLTRALEEERRNVSLQLERANVPSERMSMCNIGNDQPLATAWQQLVLQKYVCIEKGCPACRPKVFPSSSKMQWLAVEELQLKYIGSAFHSMHILHQM
ncbi:hypothetical protein XELAEV_18010553mg [Xenopus laevis]|uniref:Uncharacterized protein n=1 Tax=Xenopus laevis TaxID=8355 RepID=A0A974DWV9_XENLA|nr:hypothetical protein XELAEV_18010553mg [Xenopus laevis]